MSKESNKGYILKKEKGSGQFEELYLEGIELLQKLSGADWTDYNEHDPGVTILENITYTMTNLSLKTQQPIEDILVESKGSQLKSGDNGFYIPSEILTTNPVTINDFRKLIIDRVKNTKNVWIKFEIQNSTNSADYQQQQNIKGLYHIYIELYSYLSTSNTIYDERNSVINEATKMFHEHRNLCENLHKITIVEPLKLYLKLKLTLEDFTSGEEIFANIFYKINDYLSHGVRYTSLWELKQKNVSTNSIFNGPLLKNGFIVDSELRERQQHIVLADIVKIISKTKSVISVDFFELYFQNKAAKEWTKITEEVFYISDNYTPKLVIPETNEDLVLQYQGMEFSPHISELQKLLSYIKANNYGSFKSKSQSINEIGIPKGKSLGLSSYYSIREQFPLNYGISKMGLPSNLPSIRHAQASQLKAYLLPFDQLMSNFLSQLTSLYKIYDTQNLNSYFYQELEDMPELVHLIKKSHHKNNEESLESWQSTLKTLNSQYDKSAIQRLNQVANHLLARFGEEFPTYSLRKIHINCYGNRTTNQKFDKCLLDWKRSLISNYDKISYNRAKGCNYTKKPLSQHNYELKCDSVEPGIIQKVAILMGIRNCKSRLLSKLLIDSGIKIYQRKEGVKIISEKLEIIYPKKETEIITVEEIIIVDDVIENLRDSFYFSGNSENILKDVLRNGVLKENYKIKQTNGDSNNSFYVLFKSSKQFNVIHISESIKEAKEAIKFSVDFLADINEKTEGLHLVEHILLAPPLHGNYYGFSFSIPLDKEITIKYKHASLSPFEDRNNCVNEIMNNLYGKGTMQLRVIGLEDKYVIYVFNKEGKQLAVTNNTFAEKEIAQEILEKIVDQFSIFKKKQFVEDVKYYAYYGNEELKLDETFFSFRTSLIMPSWPVRFQDKNFRTQMVNIIYEHAPAHIDFQLFWLNLNDMISFEEDYYKWMCYVADSEAVGEQMHYAYKIITKIKQYSKE